MSDSCEWNPITNDWAYEDEYHAEAKYIVGKDGYRLCEECSKLPKFKRMKKLEVVHDR